LKWNNVTNSTTCDRFKNANLKEPLIFHEQSSLSFEILRTDILTYGGKDYIGIFDHFSKWLEIIDIKSKIAGEVVDKFKQLFCTHRYPNLT